MKRVLEVNVDDLHTGGVYSLVKNVIENNREQITIDIASYEKFEEKKHIEELKNNGTTVHYVGYKGNKLLKQFYCYRNLKRLIEKEQYTCIHIHADVANKILISAWAAKKAGAEKIILHSHAAGVDGDHRKIKSIVHKLSSYFLKNVGTDFVACSDLAAA